MVTKKSRLAAGICKNKKNRQVVSAGLTKGE